MAPHEHLSHAPRISIVVFSGLKSLAACLCCRRVSIVWSWNSVTEPQLSQIANAVYLARKGTCPWPRSLRQMGRNVGMNLARALRPEPYVDRAGRLKGNLKAVRDLVAGRLHPQRILEL